MASSPATMSAFLTPKIEGSKIYFVPIGDFPTEQLQPLVEFYRQKYKLGIAVLNSIPVDPVTRNASRQQLVAENLVASVRSGVPEHSSVCGCARSSQKTWASSTMVCPRARMQKVCSITKLWELKNSTKLGTTSNLVSPEYFVICFYPTTHGLTLLTIDAGASTSSSTAPSLYFRE
jgi:hypothetical protein